MKGQRRSTAQIVFAGVMGCCLVAPSTAQEAASNGDSASVQPMSSQVVTGEAQAVLDRMTAYMTGLQNFSIESHSSREEVLPYGYKLQYNESASLIVRRPNQMRSEVSGDLRNRSFVYDGAKLVLYSSDDDAFARMDAPDTISKLVSSVLDEGIDLPLIDVLYQAGNGTLTDQVRSGIRVGDATIEGVKCDHLAFRQAGADWQLWVEKGARPLPRKIVITTRYEVGDPQFEARLNWNLQPKISATTFAFVAPKGAVEIPFDRPAVVSGGTQ